VLGAARRLGLETDRRAARHAARAARAPLRQSLLRRLDQALGRAAEPFDPIVPEEPPSVLLRFLEPIATAEAIAEAMAASGAPADPLLPRAGLGARRLTLICAGRRRGAAAIAIGTARPPATARICSRLLREDRDDRARLRHRARCAWSPAARAARARSRSKARWPASRPAPDLALLSTGSPPGSGAPPVPARRGRKRRSRAQRRRVGPLAGAEAWPQWPRPVRLLSPPERVDNVIALLPDQPPRRFTWRGRPTASARPTGPSVSMANGGARGEAEAVRDYFQVEDEAGGASGSSAAATASMAAPATSAGTCTGCSDERVQNDLCRAPGDEPFQLPARGLQREELFAAAALLGYPALGITDRNSVGGLVKRAARIRGDRRPPGRRLPARSDGRLLAAGLAGGPRRLVAPHPPAHLGKKAGRPEEGREGPMLPPLGGCRCLVRRAGRGARPGRGRFRHRDRAGADRRYFRRPRPSARSPIAAAPATRCGSTSSTAMARRFGVRSLATGDMLYDGPDKRMLQDVVTAIRNKCTIDDLGFRRERYADRHLKSPAEMERRFAAYPDAIRRAPTSPSAAPSRLRELSYQYPDEIVMSGRTPQEALERLTRDALERQIPGRRTAEAYRSCSSMS
jgi:hypothetical protein